jgi:nucleoside-diphosphate-sugar epimerase
MGDRRDAKPAEGGLRGMMLVTGCAGFVGSRLTERLLAMGHEVLGVDSFSNYYPRERKEANLRVARDYDRFQLVEADLAAADLENLLKDVDTAFHQAAQPGVRVSWGIQFEHYLRDNLLATQRLLEAARVSDLRRVIFASSSSVYGDAERSPTDETVTPKPISPYGVTKAAAEALCDLYRKQFGIDVVTLRYFTVYGPRQRPDMALSRFIDVITDRCPVTVYGDGRQRRDFTFVDDIVEANVLAAGAPVAGETFNIGGGAVFELRRVIEMLAETLDMPVEIYHRSVAAGDVRSTSADTAKARRELGFSPQVELPEGLSRQVEWAVTGIEPESVL